MRLSDISIKNPVMAWMIMFFLLTFGAISFTRLGISQYPDIDFPNVNISITLNGAPPEVIETTIIEPLEDALTTVEGVKTMSSSSRTGAGNVNLEFDIDRNIELAMQDVQTKVSQSIKRLPKDIDQPVISKSNPEDQPIMFLIVSTSNKSRRELMKFTREHVKDQFTSISGVGDVTLNGFIDPILNVKVVPEKLKKHNITILDIIDTIQNEHNELPSGQIDDAATVFSVRLKGELKDITGFKNLIIANRAGQLNSDSMNKVRLSDVAEVTFDLADDKRLSRFNEKTSVSMGIKKQRGTNSVDVAKLIKEKISHLQKTLPDGYNINIGFDSTQFIEKSIEELNKHLIMAVLLTALVCWIFLGSLAATFNVLLSIPTSICGAFIALYFLGYTLNTFTLLGLTLSIGIVVDDAIMVLENIFRNNEIQNNRIESSIIGAREITFAAIAATVAVVAIFLPVAFMKGIIGKFFMQFGVTISIAVLFSLMEALTITPMRSAFFSQSTERTTRLGLFFERTYEKVSQLYLKWLRKCLARPWTTLIISFLVTLASFFLIKFIPKEFMPPLQSGLTFVSVQLEVGTPFSVTESRLQKVEAWLKTQNQYVERFSVSIDNDPNRARIMVGVKAKEISGMAQIAYNDILRKNIKELMNGKVSVYDLASRGFGGGHSKGLPVEFIIKGPDWDELTAQSEALMKKMTDSGIFVDVDSNLSYGLPEIQIVPSRDKSSELGVSVKQIARTVSAMISGYTAAQFTEDGKRYDIVVSLDKSKDQMSDLKNIYVSNVKGNFIPVSRIVNFENKKTLQQINRVDRTRAVSISSNLVKGYASDKAWDLVNKMAKETLKEGFYLESYGTSQAQDETFKSLIFALILGLIVAYMILASQFNSFIDPITVLIVLPFSISGVFLGLWLTHQTINIYSMIGVLLLMGIVKKNSILLVDFANQEMKKEKTDISQAMIQAGRYRLRPILMTSFATIAGAIPSAMASGPGSELTRSMAMSIVFGVFIATLFTLFVVPAVYIKFEKFRKNRHFDAEVRSAFIKVGNKGLE